MRTIPSTALLTMYHSYTSARGDIQYKSQYSYSTMVEPKDLVHQSAFVGRWTPGTFFGSMLQDRRPSDFVIWQLNTAVLRGG
jgi:hypothetical protein